jgi:hypothetical protein
VRSWIAVGRGFLAVLALSVILAACTRLPGTGNGEEISDSPTSTAVISSTATPTSIIIPTVTATPTPEPPQPSLTASDQLLDEDGQITIDQVNALEPGWVVVYADEGGETGPVLGYVNVDEGQHEDIIISIDPFQASPVLYAILHLDAGEAGAFEDPGPDQPVRAGSDVVMDEFDVDLQIIVPEVTVTDQELADDGSIFVDKVVAIEPGWIALHADQDGTPGELLGFAPVDRGENEDVAVKLNWRVATPTLHAVLYEDAGEMGHFESPEVDKPVVIGEDPIVATFRAIFPPDILVMDQPILDGAITVERATSFGPGWVAVYQDDNGRPGNIIGWSQLEDGVNHQVVISVTESAVTPVLHLMLHEDQESVGDFGFPRTDPQVRYQGRLPNPFTMRTDAGNFIITQDQVLSDTNTVTIPLVVVDLDAWVVVRDGPITELGEISGRQWLPAGYHRNVVVEIDPEIISDTMHAVLHVDGGFSQEFEYPDGLDVPLQRNRSVIQAPFELVQEGDNP